MLKRLRPFSPPPPVLESAQSPALMTGSNLVERLVKRRRVGGHHHTNPIEHDDELSEEDDCPETIRPVSTEEPQIREEYARSNSLLNELHTLHHHRLMFLNHPPESLSRKVDSLSSQQGEPLNTHRKQGPLPSTDSGYQLSEQETDRVTTEYENTNRLLGSLVLSRRRHLNTNDVN